MDRRCWHCRCSSSWRSKCPCCKPTAALLSTTTATCGNGSNFSVTAQLPISGMPSNWHRRHLDEKSREVIAGLKLVREALQPVKETVAHVRTVWLNTNNLIAILSNKHVTEDEEGEEDNVRTSMPRLYSTGRIKEYTLLKVLRLYRDFLRGKVCLFLQEHCRGGRPHVVCSN
uniref:erythropoietin-like isoform X3 n=1 Tax=Myxine glutinosa TaxID=7769 RepID=UPI00358E6FA2